MIDLAADILIVGAGGAGMYAALSAVRAGAERVLLVDKSLIGRGGATVMAQMTVAAALRRQVARVDAIRRVSNLTVTDLVLADGEVAGAVALDFETGEPVAIAAKAVIVATGGLTRIFSRNSASANMGGDGYTLALTAGAELVDMEFVQFFPIGHLAPRLVGMDPIMWDPFRYKLGGRLLDGNGREFLSDYGSDETGGYTTPRDIATYAIHKEVAAGRGSPHGGVYLSFAHVPRSALEGAFGPVIQRLAKNGIDLGAAPIEVAPIAHYHMGGIAVDERMASRVPGLFAAGEAAGGANGANRLSGNAIPEALVFGEQAGTAAAGFATGRRLPDWPNGAGASAVAQIRSLADGRGGDSAAVQLLDELRE